MNTEVQIFGYFLAVQLMLNPLQLKEKDLMYTVQKTGYTLSYILRVF